MLLQLENTSQEKINLLLNFAKKNQLKLELIDEGRNNHYLPGKPLREDELINLIEESRKSGIISMKEAHHIIRKSFDAD